LAALHRICLTGAESTGKSVLAEIIGERYRATVAPEYAREYAIRVARPLTYDDVEPIARGQIAGEDRALATAYGVVILDTDLVSTVVYSRYYWNACPDWIERAARERVADLYLLLSPDVSWIGDPARDANADREAVHAEFVRTLAEFRVRPAVIDGDWHERERKAFAAISAATLTP
jgi:NadR type nicotinamide-nucleotide adenylyltransferase